MNERNPEPGSPRHSVGKNPAGSALAKALDDLQQMSNAEYHLLLRLQISLQDLKKFHVVMEKAIAAHRERMERDALVEVVSTPAPGHKDLEDWLADDIQDTVGTFSTFLRGGLLITCFSILESSLRAACMHPNFDWNAKQHPGGAIRESWSYLQAIGADLSEARDTKRTIRLLLDIRNVFAHSGGQLGDEQRSTRIRHFVGQHAELFEDGPKNRLLLSDKFCPFVIKTLDTYRVKLLVGLPK